jgi:hypothetical protein
MNQTGGILRRQSHLVEVVLNPVCIIRFFGARYATGLLFKKCLNTLIKQPILVK